MILILGGSKSGKTSFAESLAAEKAEAGNAQVVYLASAQAWDDEMKLRIRRHQAQRPSHWITKEEALAIPDAIRSFSREKNHVVLFDCLTLWLNNILMDLGEDFKRIEAEERVDREIEDLLDAADAFPGEIIIVSNLVEQGLVSPHFLGRIFQELSGRSHQAIASRAFEVFHVIAGLPQKLK